MLDIFSLLKFVIKKVVLQNVSKIEFYFQIHLRQNSIIFSRISPYPTAKVGLSSAKLGLSCAKVGLICAKLRLSCAKVELRCAMLGLS